MECENTDEKSFHQVVLTIKEKLEKHDLKKWKNIVKPEDEAAYNEYFDRIIREGDNEVKEEEQGGEDSGEEEKKRLMEKNTIGRTYKGEEAGKEKAMRREYGKRRYEVNKVFFDSISNREKFYFLLKIKEIMETSWLLAHKRLEGVKLEENSKSVNVQELIDYSKKISDTTCAPPECDNINDKLIHQEYYPNYHFLNFVNIEEMHLSKLFQLQKYSTVCFPPIITIQESNPSMDRNYGKSMLTVDITCTTPNSTIFYKVNDDIKERIYDADNKPNIAKRKKINIYAWSTKPGCMKSRVSYISKSYEVQEEEEEQVYNSHTQSNLRNEELEKPSHMSKSDKDENTSDKPSTITNVFKNLGMLLSRKKEKTQEPSSNEESSSSGD
ncbi:conserved Plasmodium protein, unknown function [Plasmodium ovale]|uniref:Mediator of RNA polymerase II transcription subunit 4 n=2 Tax=Plasmodium ovale TaxID=36330 RepID=A0A1A8W356_PLAOA|nr:hypothetical protein POVCU2_0036990 [Plasmodium ovale curtisi]SBS96809.1 hypothetical protein POVCU1_034050 [Plasmodium ovale curtisi]SCP05630.1 conserved Plasmodium protein, unknown function [Plasmodium ovale]